MTLIMLPLKPQNIRYSLSWYCLFSFIMSWSPNSQSNTPYKEENTGAVISTGEGQTCLPFSAYHYTLCFSLPPWPNAWARTCTAQVVTQGILYQADIAKGGRKMCFTSKYMQCICNKDLWLWHCPHSAKLDPHISLQYIHKQSTTMTKQL